MKAPIQIHTKIKKITFILVKKFFIEIFTKKIIISKFRLNLFGIVMLSMGAVVASYLTISKILLPFVYAAGSSQSWAFASSGDYTISDSSLVEISGGSAQLKVRNYSSDANTAALFHFDEAAGNPTDSSANAASATSTSVTYAAGKLNNAATFNGTSSMISVPDSSALSFTQSNTIEAWTKFSSAFSANSHSTKQGIVDKGSYQLYYDNETGKLTYQLARAGATDWAQSAGSDMLNGSLSKGLNGSWDQNGKPFINASVVIGTDLYVGLGNNIADAEVWKWNGTTWTMIGGNGLSGSWADSTYEQVASMATDGTNLFVGLGSGTGDGEVWKYASSTWTKIGGDASGAGGQSWTNAYEQVTAMTVSGTTLFVGLGNTAADAEVWSCTISSCATTSGWTKIGGDGTTTGVQSWGTSYESVYALAVSGTTLLVGLGNTAGDGELWSCTIGSCTVTTGWTKIGGDATGTSGQSWTNVVELVNTIAVSGTKIYVGLGNTGSDGEVWTCDLAVSCTITAGWTKIGGGGDGTTNWGAGYESVYVLTVSGSTLYAGLGVTAGDNELWSCAVSSCNNGTSWTKIGGDGVSSGFTNTHTQVQTVSIIGSTVYAGISHASSTASAEVWSLTGGTWSRIGGNYINNSWGFVGLQSVESLQSANGKLYAGTGNATAGNALVWEFDGTTWTLIGGQGINSSWTANTYDVVSSMANFNGALVVGLGITAGEGEVWSWNGSTWTKIGGDGTGAGGQSWGSVYESVPSMSVWNGTLYVGLGNTPGGDAELWKCSSSCTVTTGWTKVGGDASAAGGQSWSNAYESVTAITQYNNQLIVGLGTGAGDAELWACSGTCTTTSGWTKIAGDASGASGQSWVTSAYEQVDSLAVYKGELYAGLALSAGDAEVWKCSGACTTTSGWTMVGGDGVNSSWSNALYERVRSIEVYNGELYAGLGNSDSEAEVWKYDGSTWVKVGGDSNNNGWTTNVNDVPAMANYKGKLYAATGGAAGTSGTTVTEGMVWAYGNNAVLQSTTNSQDTNWHHVAATFNGSAMKIYIDGVEDGSSSVSFTLPDSATSLLVGSEAGSGGAGMAQGFFGGSIDELRLSDSVRSSFTTTPYASTVQTVQPNSAVFTSGIKSFDTFSSTETLNGGSLTFRLSNDSGVTWKYYSGGSWTTSSSTAQASDEATVNTNISSFPVTSGGLLWQGILSGNGNQQVIITNITVTATEDTTPPTAPSTISALDQSGGSIDLTTNVWYSYSSPYFTWSGSTDTGGSGVAGYYVYFGTDSSADPVTAGAFQAGNSYSASGLSSGSTYYLRIKAKDNAQNSSSVYAAFIYKYDSTAPSNPSVITVSPSGYTATNSYTFTWAVDASDGGSNIAGYQYKTGASSGPLSTYSTTITANFITISGAAYQDGANTFYLRTVDNAGNISPTPLQTTYYYSGSAPSVPQSVNVNPLVNSTENSFAFSWTAPSAYVGSAADITYCYTVNVLPTVDNCTYTSAGATSLSASSFATQPGTNVFYIVAKDGTGNVSYTSYGSVEFTYSGTAPGIPRNLDVSDISIKTTSNWKLALTWDAPADTGAGVDSYKIYRSTTNATCGDDLSAFTLKGSTSGTSFADAGLSQSTYYYCVKACDSANSCSAASSTKSGYPTGKFTSAAGLSSGPVATSVTTKKALISWSTDRDSDSKVAYGTSAGTYLDSEPSNSTQLTDHSISLSNLSPGTTYYYKAKWTDEDGNTGASEEKSFITDPAPTVTDPKIKRAGLTEVDLEFKLKGASKVKIYYGQTAAFGGIKELSTSTVESTYTASLDKLSDGIKYYYKINTFDSEGSEYEGSVLSFETLPRPKISVVRVQEVRGTAQTTMLVSWLTNTETSSIVTYYPEGNPADARDEVNVALKKDEHKIILKSLLPQTNYVLVVKGRDKSGNEAQSEPQKFTTSTDTRPPQISDLRIEGSTIASKDNTQDQTAQLTISWNTDEPSTSQVEFGEGTGTTYSQKTQEDSNLSMNHVVVISGLIPSKVYHLHAVNKDKAGNTGNSVDNVTITPKATDSALDLVLKNLQNIFGFLGAKNN